MDATEELGVCSHCNKEVVKVNLPMHEAHCQRFLCLCPDCEDQVPKDQLEEHQKEQHALVKCQKCNMKMEKRELADHEENECTERLQTCEYCELDHPFSLMKDHVVACGSRTERCRDCNQYVTLKDWPRHTQICISEDLSFKTIKGNVNPLPVDTLQEDELDDYKTYGSKDQGVSQAADSEPEDTTLSLSDLQKKKQDEKKGQRDKDQISTCPHCHLALPVNTLQWHEDKCRLVEVLKRLKSMQA